MNLKKCLIVICYIDMKTDNSSDISYLILNCLYYKQVCDFKDKRYFGFFFIYFSFKSILHITGFLFMNPVILATAKWLVGTCLIFDPLPRDMLVQLCVFGTFEKLWSLNPCRLFIKSSIWISDRLSCKQLSECLKFKKQNFQTSFIVEAL